MGSAHYGAAHAHIKDAPGLVRATDSWLATIPVAMLAPAIGTEPGMKLHMILACMLALPMVAMAACPAPLAGTGDATSYSYEGIGTCGYVTYPAGSLVAAVAAPDWAGSARCGECLEVTGPLGTVMVTVVGRCPECEESNLDLSEPAFEQIAPLATGIAAIRWKRVDCADSGNLVTRVLASSNHWYIELRPEQHLHGIASLQARVDGTWVPFTRSDYNSFSLPSPIEVSGTFPVRLTSTAGEVIEHTIPDAAVPGPVDSGQQFETCVDETIFRDGFEPPVTA